MQVMSKAGWEAFLVHCADGSHVSEDDFSKHFVHACQLLAGGPPANWQRNLTQTIAALGSWMSGGMKGEVPWPIKGKSTEHAKWALLRTMMGPGYDGEVPAHLPLLALESLFCEQRQRAPYLTQGTILRFKDKAGLYLVCTTPLCDAARPTKVQNVFTFVTAEAVPLQANQYPGHGYVVHDDGKLVCLHIHAKPMVTLKIMNTALDADVIAHGWIPGTASEPPPMSEPITLSPVSQLRSQPALALAESVSSEATRIGLDRVEFVRKLFKK